MADGRLFENRQYAITRPRIVRVWPDYYNMASRGFVSISWASYQTMPTTPIKPQIPFANVIGLGHNKNVLYPRPITLAEIYLQFYRCHGPYTVPDKGIWGPRLDTIMGPPTVIFSPIVSYPHRNSGVSPSPRKMWSCKCPQTLEYYWLN